MMLKLWHQAPYFQTSSYSTASLHSFIIVLFEKYVNLLQAQFARQFEAVRFSSVDTSVFFSTIPLNTDRA